MAANENNVTLRSVIARPLLYEEVDTNFEELKFIIVDFKNHITNSGSASYVDMGTGEDQIRTNAQNETLFTDEQETTDIAVDNSITFAIALG